MLKGVSSGNVIDKQCPSGTAVIASGNGSKGLLASRVPNLQLYQLVLEINHASAKLNANRQVVDGLKSLISEL
jgi:hypothetical protein